MFLEVFLYMEYENITINSERWFDNKDLLNETWKNYEYNGKIYYEVSNYGRLRSLTRTRLLFNGVPCVQVGKIKKAYKVKRDSNTYLSYGLSFDGKVKQEPAHRLVAICFLPKHDFKYLDTENIENIDFNTLEVNHKDENGLNNRVDNLEWCTHLYNINYGSRTKRATRSASKEIEQYDKQGKFIKEWSSLAEASNELHISRGTLCSALKGDIKSCGGFQWRYKGSDKIINVYKANCMARKVVQLDLENNIVAIYNSLHDAERISGVWMTQIKKCCDKVPMYNTAKGYKWCWESDYRE